MYYTALKQNMYSKEESKFNQECNDTASSEFFTPAPPASIQERHNRSDPASIPQLEGHLAKVRQILAAANQLFKRLESNEDLERYVEETLQELNVVKARSISEQNNLKSSFEKNFHSLERELSSYSKNWRTAKENAEAEIEEWVSNFRQGIKKDQQYLNKLMNSVASDIRSKTSLVTQEIKQTKKGRKESNKGLMELLEKARAKFDILSEKERKKRNEYDSIVLGLLDRTVDQGERLMRRIG